MTTHRGIHPRIGALDVLPFVPLREMSMAEAVAIAHRVGRTLGTRFELPIFFYAEAALSPERKSLPWIRRGEYEGLARRLADPVCLVPLRPGGSCARHGDGRPLPASRWRTRSSRPGPALTPR